MAHNISIVQLVWLCIAQTLKSYPWYLIRMPLTLKQIMSTWVIFKLKAVKGNSAVKTHTSS